DRWDTAKNCFKSSSSPVVTLKQLSVAIEQYNLQNPSTRPLSTRNPANFFKDLIRNRASSNLNWPASLWNRGYTARQKTGGGNAFEFVKAPVGQAEPFTSATQPYPRSPNLLRHTLQSVSLPPLARL